MAHITVNLNLSELPEGHLAVNCGSRESPEGGFTVNRGPMWTMPGASDSP